MQEAFREQFLELDLRSDGTFRWRERYSRSRGDWQVEGRTLVLRSTSAPPQEAATRTPGVWSMRLAVEKPGLLVLDAKGGERIKLERAGK